jgi:aryl-alcohol dehydrogenase-like predicted oxidoreductase
MSKFVLGTAQFGLNYGINNQKGKIPRRQVFEILESASKFDIKLLDTAYDYGDSEKSLGIYKQRFGPKFKIISKLPSIANYSNIDILIRRTLARLKLNSLYGYLFHNFNSLVNHPELLEKMQSYKKRGLIKKIGFSLYYPSELEYLLNNKVKFDLVQIPYSVFDQRFANYFPRLNKEGIEVYARSIFLQGLVFKKTQKLSPDFSELKRKLKILNCLSNKHALPVASICMNFVLLNKNIDKIIIGVDNIDNLKENLMSAGHARSITKFHHQLLRLKITDENIILPTNWK